MLGHICLWSLDNRAPSTLMVISKNITQEPELIKVLQALRSKNHNVLVAQPPDCNVETAVLLQTVSSSIWCSRILLDRGILIEQSGSSQHVVSTTCTCNGCLQAVANKLANKRNKRKKQQERKKRKKQKKQKKRKVTTTTKGETECK